MQVALTLVQYLWAISNLSATLIRGSTWVSSRLTQKYQTGAEVTDIDQPSNLLLWGISYDS
jgi:hypothetical protein